MRTAPPSPDPPARPLDHLAEFFRFFATRECPHEPVYVALCHAAAADPDTLQLLWAAPDRTQQRPNLLLAAVHYLILNGSAHPLREYFPSAGGSRAVDTAFADCFTSFRAAHASELRALIASRATQTNEVGRCAALWPALLHIAAASGHGELALLDFGCSAGLNLGVDRYRYDYGSYVGGAVAESGSPTIACRLIGPHALPRPPAGGLRIGSRLGLDVAPAPVHDADAMRWLRACVWPHDQERARRFDAAVALARRHRWPVRREADCVAALDAWVRALPQGALAVVVNSWVLTYLEREARHRYAATLEALAQERRAVWLSAEGPQLQPPAAAVRAHARVRPPSLPGTEYEAGSLWTLCSAGASGPAYAVIARAHHHGKWLEWLA